jgi:hypothetical protein
MTEEVDRRPKLSVLKHIDVGHNLDANRAAIAVETDRGPVVLVMSTDVLFEHIKACREILKMLHELEAQP